MKQSCCLTLVLLTSLCSVRAQEPGIVFQIGKPDGDYGEFAMAGNYARYSQQLPHDVNFVVGQSEANRDWPFIHPGPTDAWAGSR